MAATVTQGTGSKVIVFGGSTIKEYERTSEELIPLLANLTLACDPDNTTISFRLARFDKMSDKLFDLKTQVYSMCLERFFMKELNASVRLNEAYKIQEELKSKGFHFYYNKSVFSYSFPHLAEDLPLPMLQCICRISKLSKTTYQTETAITQEKVLHAIDPFLPLIRSQRRSQIVYDTITVLRYSLLKYSYSEHEPVIKELFANIPQYMSRYPKAKFSLAMQKILEAETLLTDGRLTIDKEQSSLPDDDEQREEYQRRIVANHVAYCRTIIENLVKYHQEMPSRQQEFNVTLQELKAATRKEYGTRNYGILFKGKEKESFTSLYEEPANFGKFEINWDVSTIIDAMLKARSSTTPQRKVSKKHILKSKIPSQKKVPTSTSHTQELPTPPDSSIAPLPQETITIPCSENEREPTLPVAERRKKQKRVIVKDSSVSERPAPLYVQRLLGLGPNLSYRYNWHIRRWEKNSGFNPLTQDPAYKVTKFSNEEAEEEQLRHSWGRALDQVILMTKPFVKIAPTTNIVLRKHFSLLGEVVSRTGHRIRGIFTLTVGLDGRFMHKFFTKMTTDELFAKYQREGSFAMDVTDPFSDTSIVVNDNDLLPDDESRITHVSSEAVVVKCKNGEILIATPPK